MLVEYDATENINTNGQSVPISQDAKRWFVHGESFPDPLAMIDLTEGLGVDGQISLETMMGCGFGICVGCPVETKAPGPSDKLYRLTCIDGPVFDARSVILHD